MSTEPLTEDQVEAGRLLFAQACTFVLGAANLSQVPPSTLPEIAFAGRSNVGKSSLVNALTGRKTLARTSNTPGRTQQINFFDLGDRLMMADLPGYGYAKAPIPEVKRWTRVMRDYLRGRAQLRRVLMMVDARHGLKDTDRQVMDTLDEAAVSYQVVLTKIDKVSSTALTELKQKTLMELSRHVASHPEVMATSAKDGIGIAELRAILATLANPA